MPKSDYMPSDDDGKAKLFISFSTAITPYLATFSLGTAAAPTSEIVQQAADAIYFRALVDYQEQMQQSAQGWTAWKNYLRDGGTGTPPNPSVPALPAGFPAAVPPGIVARFRALARSLKAHKNCTPAISQALGLEGSVSAPFDAATLKPLLTLRLNGGKVEIPWDWGGYSGQLEGIEIQVDRDGKGFTLLTIDTTAGYTDTAELPATPTKWTYRAIYRLNDTRIGQWSDEASITVGA